MPVNIPPMLLEWANNLRSSRLQFAVIVLAIIWLAPRWVLPEMDVAFAAGLVSWQAIATGILGAGVVIGLSLRPPQSPADEAKEGGTNATG